MRMERWVRTLPRPQRMQRRRIHLWMVVLVGHSQLTRVKEIHPLGQGCSQMPPKMDFEVPAIEHVPRVLPKDADPSLVKRNKRMLGQLLGTLEKFRKEELSGTEAYMRRSNSLQRVIRKE